MGQNNLQLAPVTDLTSVQRNFDYIRKNINGQSSPIDMFSGKGSPEGVIKANKSAIYTDKNTGDMYLKTKDSGKTGWMIVPLTATTPTTTPALTGKYVLPSTYPLNSATPQKILYITIPMSGLYAIDGFFNYLSTSGAAYAHFYLAKNGTQITGLGIEPYTAATGSQFPITIAYKDTFNAGDEIAVYGYVDVGYVGDVHVQNPTRQAFIQYTQLQSNVPVVTTVTKEYGLFKIAGSQQTTGLSAGNPIQFSTPEVGNNIIYDPTTFRFTLKANIKYKLKCSAAGYGGASANPYLEYMFYNVTGGYYIGVEAEGVAVTYTGGYICQNIPVATITPAVDTQIEVRIVANNLISAINSSYSWLEIESIEANVPVVATLGQDAWVGGLQDLIVSSRGVAKVDGMTKVKFRKDSEGNWFANLFISESVASGSRTGQQWYTDLVFKSLPANCYHSLTGNCFNAIPLNYCAAYPLQGRIDIYHSGGATTSYGVNGEIPLNSKPVGYGIPDSV